MITTAKNPTKEDSNSELLQARNKLKKVSSNGITEEIKVEEPPAAAASENIGVTSDDDSNSDQERTLAILTDASNMDEIIQYIESNGFKVVATKRFELSTREAEDFYEDHAKQNYYEKCVRWLSSSKLCALILEKHDAIKDWKQLMGPTTYKKARKTSPNSIRALFGKDASQNATHGSDSDVNARKEIEYLFGDLTTAETTTVDNAITAQRSNPNQSNEMFQPQQDESKVLSDAKEEPMHKSTKVGDETIPVSKNEEALGIDDKEKNAPLNTKQDIVESEIKKELQIIKDVQKTKEQDIGSSCSMFDSVNTESKAAEHDALFATEKQNQDKSVSEQKQDIVESEIKKELKTIKDIQRSKEREADANSGIPDRVNEDTIPTENENSSNNKSHELSKDDGEKQQDSGTLLAAATTVTSTAASLATTVVSGVAEVASVAASAVSAVITSPEVDQENESDSNSVNESEQKAATTGDDPVIHDMNAPESLSITLQKDSSMSDTGKTETVVPENNSATFVTTIANQATSSSDLDNDNKQSLSSKDIKSADASTDQGDNSSRTSVSTDNAEKGLGKNSDQSTAKKMIKKSAVHPSHSRIRPPSIHRGQNSTTLLPNVANKPTQEGSADYKVRPQLRTTKASSSGGSNSSGAGGTRIARLSVPIKKAPKEEPKQRQPQQKQQPQPVHAKKAVTKISKHLPRVATLGKPPTASSKAEHDVEDNSSSATERPKKRQSSTKSFISRLTAPTVASANKKAATTTEAEHNTSPARRTGHLNKRQSLAKSHPPPKGNSNDTTIHQQHQADSEMTSNSTNDSLSRPATPIAAKKDNAKSQAFIDTGVETSV